MKSHFLKLINYDRFANLAILELIIAAGISGFPVKLMAHIMAAQQVWLNRCKGLPPFSGALWPEGVVDDFEKMINDNHAAWVAYVDGLPYEDFEKTIAYKTLKGEPFENQLSDIITHLVNHGTHHRAQAGQHLKLAGVKNLPVTDYIFYLRHN
jgi:uncharacterized damage-inducible protein DinB